MTYDFCLDLRGELLPLMFVTCTESYVRLIHLGQTLVVESQEDLAFLPQTA